jgi:hypothetical protein
VKFRWRAGFCTAALLTVVTGGAPASGQRREEATAADRVRAHMEFLADDLLEGRRTGTRGYDVAARYVASTLKTYGFAPAGSDGTYFQPVPLRASTQQAATLRVAPAKGAPVTLHVPQDAVVLPELIRPRSELTAPLVYAGFGVTAPELGYDDYAQIDARGKVVLILSNAPAQFRSEVRAYYASPTQKAATAVRHGAVGLVIMLLPEEQKRYPWEDVARFTSAPAMAWIDEQDRPVDRHPEIRGSAFLGPSGVEKLFAHAPTPLADVYAAGEKGAPRAFEMPITLTIQSAAEHATVRSANIVGLLRGTDPALADSYVVLTAHLDHEGISAPFEGDAIYNGAFDNAAGCAVLLEVARAMAAGARPRRSVLMVFVTAEEQGLLGSDYFARNPTVPGGAIVANVNLDMPLLQWPLADVVAFGAENSSLQRVAERAASQVGLKLSPDPMPEENVFVRSDQYSFVRQGVPAVFLVPGFTSSDATLKPMEIFGRFLATHYHKPTDDLSLPLHSGAVDTFTRANYLLAMAIANDPDRPTWNAGNFFGERFGQKR